MPKVTLSKTTLSKMTPQEVKTYTDLLSKNKKTRDTMVRKQRAYSVKARTTPHSILLPRLRREGFKSEKAAFDASDKYLTFVNRMRHKYSR